MERNEGSHTTTTTTDHHLICVKHHHRWLSGWGRQAALVRRVTFMIWHKEARGHEHDKEEVRSLHRWLVRQAGRQEAGGRAASTFHQRTHSHTLLNEPHQSTPNQFKPI